MPLQVDVSPDQMRSPQTASIVTGGGESIWGDCGSITDLEKDVLLHLNKARIDHQQSLIPLPISRTPQAVAWYHATGLNSEVRTTGGSDCQNLHSWDFPPPDGVYFETCCYAAQRYECMWDKGKEIGGDNSIPFLVEISAWTSAGFENNANYDGERIVQLWLNSPAHRNVLLNVDVWASFPWSGVGVAVKGNYANVWFIQKLDPNGGCATETDPNDGNNGSETGDTVEDTEGDTVVDENEETDQSDGETEETPSQIG